jgi:peroxiredoxin Q/BCP
LLADTDKAVGRSYDILGLGGLYRRSVFVIDAQGQITYAHRSLVGATFRPTSELIAAVQAAKSA